MDYIETAKSFVAAERTSDWNMHLASISKMLNLLAATGHGNYSKCSRIYLQDMKMLPQTNPLLHSEFMKGNHSVRRTDKRWSGMSSDLAIETTQIRDAKATGGLTRGRGMKERVRLVWALSISECARVHRALMDLTDTNSLVEEHVELRSFRRHTDFEDTQAFFKWLIPRNPFLIDSVHLHSLSSGIVSIKGQDVINCDQAEEIAAKIQKSFDNKSYSECIK